MISDIVDNLVPHQYMLLIVSVYLMSYYSEQAVGVPLNFPNLKRICIQLALELPSVLYVSIIQLLFILLKFFFRVLNINKCWTWALIFFLFG